MVIGEDNLPRIHDLQSLRRSIREGDDPRFIFFWAERETNTESLGTECLGQWFPATFSVKGTTYPTAEHFMMAEKARLFGDPEMLSRILEATSPRLAKKLGRKVQNFDEETWKRRRVDFVERGNLAKFSQNKELKSYLIGTGEHVLVEASPHDGVWGIGMRKRDKRAQNPFRWEGKNLLGFALMRVREALLRKGVV